LTYAFLIRYQQVYGRWPSDERSLFLFATEVYIQRWRKWIDSERRLPWLECSLRDTLQRLAAKGGAEGRCIYTRREVESVLEGSLEERGVYRDKLEHYLGVIVGSIRHAGGPLFEVAPGLVRFRHSVLQEFWERERVILD